LGASFTREDDNALVVDLGGGSAQLALGDISRGLEKQISQPLGSNRLTERYVYHEPPKPEELATLHKVVLATLPGWDMAEGAFVVAIGGSARTIPKLGGGHPTLQCLRRLAAEICAKPSAVLAREEGFSPSRARVLPAAIITLAAVLEHFGKPSLIVTRGGMIEGATLTYGRRSPKGRRPGKGEVN
jgi:exopolyphosphatase/guanosine-5'-triphosphate,3'-diphosphate pyrophosphatase